MNESQQLRESMWDLVYGLVSAEEERALIERIKSDPGAARLYAEVRLEADLVGQAAKVKDSSLAFSGSAAVKADRQPSKAVQLAKPAGSASGRQRIAPAILAALTTALLALVAAGLWWPVAGQTQLTGGLVAIDVLSDASRPAGLTRNVALRTYLVNQDGEFDEARAAVELRLFAANGREVLKQAVNTDQHGDATIQIPGAVVEPGTRMEVSAVRADNAKRLGEPGVAAKVAAELPVQPEPQMAYFLAAEPVAEEGQTVEVSLWNFSAFSTKPAPAAAAQAAIEEVEGLTVQKAETNVAQPGVLNAVVEVQHEPNADKAQQPAADVAREGGRPSASGGAPGVQLQQNAQLLQRGGQRRALSQNRAARGDQRQALGGYGGGIPAGGPEASGGEVITVPPGQPIKVPLPANLVNKELVATASCRGVVVASAVHSATGAAPGLRRKLERAQADSTEIVLELPPEADGLIEVSLYDRSSDEPVLVLQRQVYREPLKQLQISVAQGKERFAPGEQVALELRVTDEAGRPAANARLGVRVWNELSLQQSQEQPVMLADAVRNNYASITSDTSDPEPQDAPPPSRLADRREGGAGAAEAGTQTYGFERRANGAAAAERKRLAGSEVDLADQLANRQAAAAEERAGTGGEMEEPALAKAAAATGPVELASNREAIRKALFLSKQQAVEQRRQARRRIGTLVMLGGAVLLVVTALGALRHAARGAVLAPAGAVAVASVLLGVIWSGQVYGPRRGDMMATAAPQTATADAGEEPERLTTSEPASKSAFPAPSDPPAATVAMKENAAKDEAGTGSAAASLPTVTSPAAGASRPDSPALAVGDKSAQEPSDSLQLLPRVAAGDARRAASAPTASPPAEPLARAVLPPSGSAETAARSAAKEEPQAAAGAGRGGFAGQSQSNRGAGNAGQAPTALYFNPQLITDAQGRANVELVMPSVESRYRVLIDALGEGRVGSRQAQLIIDAPPAEKAAAEAK